VSKFRNYVCFDLGGEMWKVHGFLAKKSKISGEVLKNWPEDYF
jgi:hypothetical protein